MAVRERERNRCRERLEKLADGGVDSDEARREAIGALRRAVGFERWCWPLTDPGSALSTGGIAEFDLWAELPRIAVLEEHGDVTSKPELVVGRRASVTLSAATGGDLSRSRRWRECLRPHGVGDELMTACRDRHGCWGSVELMRDSDDPPFDEADADLLHELAPLLGTLLRRHAPAARVADAAQPLAPATLILDEELRPRSWTATFHDWCAALGSGGLLPPAVYEIGTRVRASSSATHGLPASVRIPTRTGLWAVLEGAALEGAALGQVAVTIRTASPSEVFDLLCKVYELTRRERELVALVLEGLATKQLAAALGISAYTVQDHLKAIFAKTRARNRLELVSQLAGRRQ
jgi:DNA-binding CsgD family transcriptional regulator